MRSAFTFLLVSLASTAMAADDPAFVNGVVQDISDGDTCTVKQDDGTSIKIRFFGVDTPEHESERWDEQPHAKRAEAFTKGLIEGARVTVAMQRRIERNELKWVKTYTRFVGDVLIDGKSVSRELVRNGHGWWYSRYSKGDEDLKRLQQIARSEKRGLWALPNPQPPWEWRQTN